MCHKVCFHSLPIDSTNYRENNRRFTAESCKNLAKRPFLPNCLLGIKFKSSKYLPLFVYYFSTITNGILLHIKDIFFYQAVKPRTVKLVLTQLKCHQLLLTGASMRIIFRTEKVSSPENVRCIVFPPLRIHLGGKLPVSPAPTSQSWV
jgi:hypothetical protein